MGTTKEVTFLSLKRSYCQFQEKIIKTPEKLSLAVVAHFEEQNCFR